MALERSRLLSKEKRVSCQLPIQYKLHHLLEKDPLCTHLLVATMLYSYSPILILRMQYLKRYDSSSVICIMGKEGCVFSFVRSTILPKQRWYPKLSYTLLHHSLSPMHLMTS